EEHVHAEAAEPGRRIGRTQRGSQPTHPLHDRREINARSGWHLDAVLSGVAEGSCHTRRGDQRLARNAADVEAVAAHELALDQGDAGPQPRGTGGTDEPIRAAERAQYTSWAKIPVLKPVYPNRKSL